jgi:hypothetical protein
MHMTVNMNANIGRGVLSHRTGPCPGTSAKWDGPLGIILDTIAECQAQLEDNNVDKLRAALTAPPLLQAMYDIGYFPKNNPPGAMFTLPYR